MIIHVADWQRYWSERDRKIADSLEKVDPEAFDKWLADQEAVKADIKRKRRGK